MTNEEAVIRARYEHEPCLSPAERERHIALALERITTPLNGGTTQRTEASASVRVNQTSRDGLGDSCERGEVGDASKGGDVRWQQESMSETTAATHSVGNTGRPSPANTPRHYPDMREQAVKWCDAIIRASHDT